MKHIKILLLLILLVAPLYAAPKNGEELIAQMQKKYAGKWYKTLTFVQKTVFFKPDGTSDVQIWYEAMSLPGKLRIDIAPLEKGDGILFVDDKLSSIRGGKSLRTQPFIHPLLVLGFDVYGQSAEKTVRQLKELKMDLSILREDVWQGKPVYVVGAKKDDSRSPQFWIEKKNLLFVRLIEPTGKDGANIQEIQFNKYQKIKGGGWISPEVIAIVDGKTVQTEEYTDIQANIPLDEKLFDPMSWMTVDKNYFQIKTKNPKSKI
jgi:outer membrane lipoprotein-sorting protein